MNSQQAKFILQSWRASGLDDTDPRFEEALQAVENDPELAAWFERELALDRIIANKLRSATAPRAQAVVDLPKPSPTTNAPTSLAAANRRHWLAWAASLAVLAVAGSLILPALRPPTDANRFRTDMAAYLNAGFSLDLMNTDPSALLEWMVARPALAAAQVPAAVRQLPAIGCRALTWAGSPVGLLCFSDGGQAVHLFVLNPPKGFEMDGITGLVVQETAGWTTAGWTQNGLVYLLARRGNESETRRLLALLNPAKSGSKSG